MWFIEGFSGTTQGKKMALVSICSAKSQGIHIPNLLLIMVHLCLYMFLLQIWEKHYHKMLRRSPSYHSRGQLRLMNLNMIDVKTSLPGAYVESSGVEFDRLWISGSVISCQCIVFFVPVRGQRFSRWTLKFLYLRIARTMSWHGIEFLCSEVAPIFILWCYLLCDLMCDVFLYSLHSTSYIWPMLSGDR